VVIDGAKALGRAVTDVFDHPVIQRCQLHSVPRGHVRSVQEEVRLVA
jgi:putative transposase